MRPSHQTSISYLSISSEYHVGAIVVGLVVVGLMLGNAVVGPKGRMAILTNALFACFRYKDLSLSVTSKVRGLTDFASVPLSKDTKW